MLSHFKYLCALTLLLILPTCAEKETPVRQSDIHETPRNRGLKSPTENVVYTFKGYFRKKGQLEILKFVRNSPNNITLYINSAFNPDWNTEVLMSVPFYWPNATRKGCKQGLFHSYLDSIACLYEHGDMHTGIVVFRPQSPGSSSWLVESWWSQKPFDIHRVWTWGPDDSTRNGLAGLKVIYSLPYDDGIQTLIFESNGKKFTKTN